MKKTSNDCYYLGVINLDKTESKSYYWNNVTKILQCWTLKDKKETLDKNVPFTKLPKEFESKFTGQDIILKKEIVPKVKKTGEMI